MTGILPGRLESVHHGPVHQFRGGGGSGQGRGAWHAGPL